MKARGVGEVFFKSFDSFEQAFRGGGNKDVTMKVYTDRNHLFLQDPSGFPGGYVKLTNGKIDGEVMGELANWLVVRLKP